MELQRELTKEQKQKLCRALEVCVQKRLTEMQELIRKRYLDVDLRVGDHRAFKFEIDVVITELLLDILDQSTPA